MPLAFAFYSKNKFQNGEKINWFVVSFGAFTGAVVSGFKAFFTLSTLYTGSNYFIYILDSWSAYGLIPVIFLVLFYFFSKDEVSYRFNQYLSFIIPFMSIYLAYECLSLSRPFPFFILFVKPVLYLCMILGIRKSLEVLYRKLTTTKKWIRDSVLILVETFVPAIIEGIWYYQYSLILLMILIAVYIAVSIIRTITIKEIKTEILQMENN